MLDITVAKIQYHAVCEHRKRTPRTAIDTTCEYPRNLPETGKASALHFTQRTTTTDECDRTNSSCRGENLEQVPRGIVEEENSLKCNQ